MKWPLFENKIKKELSGHRTEVDVDALWAAIEPDVDAINRTRRKRPFLWIWFLLAGLLVVGGGLGYYLNTIKELQGRGEAVSASQPNLPASQETTGLDNGQAAGHHASQPAAVSGAEFRSSIAGDQIQGQSETLRATGKPAIGTGTQVNHASSVHTASTTGITPGIVENRLEEGQKPIMAASSPVTLSGESIVPDGRIGEIPPGLPVRLSLLDVTVTDWKSIHPAPVDHSDDPVEKPGPPIRKNPFKVYAGVQGSLHFTGRDLSAREPGYESLASLRNGTERLLETVQLGMRFGVRHTSGFEGITGFNLTRISERFDYNTSVSAVDSVYGVKALVINLNKDTIPVYGDIPLERTTTFKKRYYNTYRMLDIPLLLGYRYQTGDFSLGVQAGVFVNLDLKVSGRFLASEGNDVNMREVGVFKPDIGLSYFFGLSAAYALTDHLEVAVTPSFRFFPESFTVDSYGLKQQYRLFGLDAGVFYHF